MFINFNDVAKGQTIKGGLTQLRIVATLLLLKIKGYKPFRYQGDKNKIPEKGYLWSYICYKLFIHQK